VKIISEWHVSHLKKAPLEATKYIFSLYSSKTQILYTKVVMPSVNSYDFRGYKYVGAPILQHKVSNLLKLKIYI